MVKVFYEKRLIMQCIFYTQQNFLSSYNSCTQIESKIGRNENLFSSYSQNR